MTIQDLVAAIGGQLVTLRAADEAARLPLGPIATDSRQVAPGCVFWGLRGAKHDGSRFAEAALERGAVAAVVEGEPVLVDEGLYIVVRDSHDALRKWARWRRARFSGTLVAVTGSMGKTTARQMIHTVLGTKLKGTVSPRNYNNHLGVPLSMAAVEGADHYAVLELGANRPGEIAQLAALCAPKVGVITHIGDAHLGGFGSRRGIAEAKAELLAALPADGRAVLGDDPWLRSVAAHSKAEITLVGESSDCDVRAQEVVSERGRLRFRIGLCPFEVPVWGRHHLTAALCSVAVARMMGFDLGEISEALRGFRPVPQRCEVTEVRGATIINDTYNASPSAMRAALELLADLETAGRRIVVCGDMAELGDDATEMHWALGEEAVQIGRVDMLFACGHYARCVISGARAAGLARPCAVPSYDVEQLLPFLGQAILPGDIVLVKGSRMMAMERVIEALKSFPRRRSA